MTESASRTSSTSSAISNKTLVSTARRNGFAAIEQFGGTTAQAAAFGEREPVHHWAILLDGEGPLGLFLSLQLGFLHQTFYPLGCDQSQTVNHGDSR